MTRRLRRAVSLAERAVIRDTTALNHRAAVRPERFPAARTTAITRRRKSAAMTEEAVPSRAHAIRTEVVVPTTNGLVEKENVTIRCSRSAARTAMIPGPVVRGNHAALPRRAVIAAKQRSVARAEPVLTRAAAVRRNAVMKTKTTVTTTASERGAGSAPTSGSGGSEPGSNPGGTVPNGGMQVVGLGAVSSVAIISACMLGMLIF
ncbi:hypothetical protein H109_07029 [Trichophyton interdigitale MR816]|uniref:Uncharacterized protein n=1 Tax=Trichophyton interdigitale (strain MR816) TaxID=1215338 RepID=A0A059IZK2_TRIIM|nr:hypothetical protein H109_07029 [Trichophyton interdigitale MR816]